MPAKAWVKVGVATCWVSPGGGQGGFGLGPSSRHGGLSGPAGRFFNALSGVVGSPSGGTFKVPLPNLANKLVVAYEDLWI